MINYQTYFNPTTSELIPPEFLFQFISESIPVSHVMESDIFIKTRDRVFEASIPTYLVHKSNASDQIAREHVFEVVDVCENPKKQIIWVNGAEYEYTQTTTS